MLTCAHAGGGWGSLISLVRALVGYDFIVGFARAHTGAPWVYPGTLSSLSPELGFVGFIRGRWIRSREPWRSFGLSGVVGLARALPGSIRGCWVRLDAPWGSLCYHRVRLRALWGCWVSSRANLGSGLAWVHSSAPRGGLVKPSSLGYTLRRLGVVGFIEVHLGSLRRA